MTNSVNENQSLDSNSVLGVQEADEEISLIDLLQTILDNLKLLVLGPIAVGVAALGISYLIPPTYTAKTQFLPPQQQQSAAVSMLASLGTLGGLAGAAAGLKNPADQYVAYLKSSSIEDALVERFKLQDRYKKKYKQDARVALEKNVRITSSKEGLISVEVDGDEPNFTAELANGYVFELRKILSRLAVTEAQQRRQFFEKQLTDSKNNLIKAEQALYKTGISDNVLKGNPATAVAAVATLKAQITIQELKIGAMKGYLNESAPEFKQAVAELTNLRTQLVKQNKAESKSDIQEQGEYINRYREFKYNETMFELFAKQYEIARVDEAREGAVIQVLDEAYPPEKKSKPKKAMITLIAGISTGILLLIYIFILKKIKIDYINKKIKIITLKK
jgi:tyrosine-protein kinase Etk/Wzc